MAKSTGGKKLGRGLGALMGNAKSKHVKEESPEPTVISHAGEPLMVPINAVHPNRKQPRTEFDEEKLQELAASIEAQGILQPIVVRRDGDGFELIAGERRLRASKLANKTEVPVVIQQVTDEHMLAAALVENIQRADLNALEVAHAYQMMADEMGLTHEEIAQQVGTSRVNVTNTLRLLGTSPAVQDCLLRGSITAGHARSLAGLNDFTTMDFYLRRILSEGLSVRSLENAVRDILISGVTAKEAKQKEAAAEAKAKPSWVGDLEDRLRQRLGTKVAIMDTKGKGSITIEYYSAEDFTRIASILGVEEQF